MRSLLLFAFIIPFAFTAQVFITNFAVQPANSSQLFITWTVPASSSSCANLELHWSTDSFKTSSTLIYTLPGICGGSGFDETYSFQHTHPDANGRNFYRLISFGAYVSQIIEYNFGEDNGEYILYPDPINDNSVLTFKNPESKTWVLDISNAACTERYQIFDITGEQTPLPASWFKQSGIYFFRMYSDTGDLIKGKFVVIHSN